MSDLLDTLQVSAVVLITAGCYAAAIALVAAIGIAPFEASDNSLAGRIWKCFLVLLGYSIPIGILAYVAGYLTVYSRTSAVGNVLPAVLALVGGANIYVFGTDSSKKGIVGFCVLLFACMIFLGTQDGAQLRERDRVSRLRQLAIQEAQIRLFRENLGLSAEPPAWILSTEPK
jgi:hypothetical protein